ncbi:MAG: cell division protein CrgA [Actinobacteria bacterium]|nr:cell division protein CrgA [Actinomycetota bacterium]
MPESKHRRKNKVRPRPRHVEEPVHKPKPSPTWVPATGVTLLLLGVLIIILGYIPSIGRWLTGLGVPLGSNLPLVLGFVLLSVGFGFLTRWR